MRAGSTVQSQDMTKKSDYEEVSHAWEFYKIALTYIESTLYQIHKHNLTALQGKKAHSSLPLILQLGHSLAAEDFERMNIIDGIGQRHIALMEHYKHEPTFLPESLAGIPEFKAWEKASPELMRPQERNFFAHGYGVLGEDEYGSDDGVLPVLAKVYGKAEGPLREFVGGIERVLERLKK